MLPGTSENDWDPVFDSTARPFIIAMRKTGFMVMVAILGRLWDHIGKTPVH